MIWVCGVMMFFIEIFFRLNRFSRMFLCFCGMKLLFLSMMECSFLGEMCCLVVCDLVLMCKILRMVDMKMLMNYISGLVMCISGFKMKLVKSVMCFGWVVLIILGMILVKMINSVVMKVVVVVIMCWWLLKVVMVSVVIRVVVSVLMMVLVMRISESSCLVWFSSYRMVMVVWLFCLVRCCR